MKYLYNVNGLEQELQLVQQYMKGFLKHETSSELLSEILQSAHLEKGKMLRPILLLLAGRLGPDYPLRQDRLCKLGALVEMTHGASLIHDDIIDDSLLRRGKPTVQSRYGKDMAVYTGDYILGKIMYYLMENEMLEAGKLIGSCVGQMCCGELKQYHMQFNTDVTERDYWQSIQGKTAALFIASCKIGAIEAGCSNKLIQHMGEIGYYIGILFQMRDDLLDFQSSELAAGKPVHCDFKQGIYTLPVIHTFENPETGSELKKIAKEIADGHQEAELMVRMNQLVEQADGVAYVRRKMEEYAKYAESLLCGLPEGDGTKTMKQVFEMILSE